jgi:hypothetical protein
VDGHLDETIASGADPPEVATVLGVAHSTAVRRAHAARQLLEPASSGKPKLTTNRRARSRSTRPIDPWVPAENPSVRAGLTDDRAGYR